MTTIEKLSIQGIRSFGSNAEDAQSIGFSSPVTLILGENGCGKTTIIECLKYALTGECPPGSDRGKNFVHDPKIFNLTDALGQIKLKVRNIQGQRLSVCRSLKVANRRGKYTFETLDSTMNYESACSNGTTDSISKRCVDVDVAMCEFMGVSKAIINNVLFCHQEDSSWPLDEPKKLKEKFDAIFGITQYNKAIEKIVKKRKDETNKLKVKESNLRFLAHLKKEMEDKSLSLEKVQKKCHSLRDECDRCDEDVKPIDNRLLEIRQVEYEIGKQQARKVELETKLKNCREQIESLTKKIKNIFDGTIDDLDGEIESYVQNMVRKKNERTELEKKLVSLKSEEKNVQKMMSDLDKKRIIFIQQREKEQECSSKRAERIKTLCNNMSIPLDIDPEFSTDSVPSIIDDLDSAILGEQCNIAEVTSKHDHEDQKFQEEIDKLRVELTKLEEGIVTLKKQKGNHEKEHQVTQEKIAGIEVSAQRISILTQNIDRFTKLSEEMKSKYNLDVMREEISASKAKIMDFQKQFRELDNKLTFLNSLSKLLSELALKEKELEKKEGEMHRVKHKHNDNMKKLLSKSVDGNFRRSVQDKYESLRNEIKDLNNKVNSLKLKEHSSDIQRKNLKEEVSKLEKELSESKERIFQKCYSTSYEDMLAKCKATVLKYQLEHGSLLSAESMYKKYIHKLEENPYCPLCHKDMSFNDVSDLSTELSDEISRLPENIKKCAKTLESEQKKYESLLQLKPVVERVVQLEKEIPERKNELKAVEEKLAECAGEIESMQLLIAEPTSDLDLANSMMGDMSLLDEAIKEILRTKKDIEELKKKLPKNYDNIDSIDDLQATKSSVSEELEKERKEVEEKQANMEKITTALNKMQEQKNNCQDERLKLQEGIQSLPQLNEHLVELAEVLMSASAEIENMKMKMPSIKNKLNETIAQKAQCKEKNRKTISKMQSKLDTHKNIFNDIKRLNSEMFEYQQLNLEQEIARLHDLIKNCRTDMEKKVNAVLSISENLDAIKTECMNQEVTERNLKDNRELKLLQQKEHELDNHNKKLSNDLGELDFPRVSKEKNGLIKKRDAITVRKGGLLGQIGEINNQISKLESEIEEPRYKDSLHNYKRANYDVEVTRRMVADLGQYRVALEWSLIEFHTEKMEKINRLIREYWRLIYRGNDIDYIQIQTDEVNTDASTDRRRNYNYRVVQSKNNSEIEMRGRCSAGQRVLASLIIRMALAETFSSNCGVLALDEPTTNLDRMNIVSLCDALNRIVDERQMQSNFMLIIITHDEEFISALGKINCYHRVFRNEDCKSVIRRVKLT